MEIGRLRRHRRFRKKVAGTSDRPRLVVRRSHKNLYVQLVDDQAGKTLVGCSTLKEKFPGGDVTSAQRLGELVAQAAIAAGLKRVVFDRGGYRYHGRVKALADAARAKGLEF